MLLPDPSFLTKQLGYTAAQQTVTSVIYNIGAIMGGTIVGYFSQYFGRKRSIIVCAIVGGAIIPLWVFAPSIASLQFGAWLMQFCVQGAWGKRNRTLSAVNKHKVRHNVSAKLTTIILILCKNNSKVLSLLT